MFSGFRRKFIGVIALIGLALIGIFMTGFYKKGEQGTPSSATNQSEEVKIISTDPNPLEEAVITPTQAIEFKFTHAVENRGEFKYQITPEEEIEIELGDDRKVVRFRARSAFKLGQGYTLFIKADTKFDGGKRLMEDKIFHFATISYNGI